MMIVYILTGVIIFYLLLTLLLTFAVQQYPRRPVSDQPDWGQVLDTTIPAKDGGSLEVWRIEPEGESRGIVVLPMAGAATATAWCHGPGCLPNSVLPR